MDPAQGPGGAAGGKPRDAGISGGTQNRGDQKCLRNQGAAMRFESLSPPGHHLRDQPEPTLLFHMKTI